MIKHLQKIISLPLLISTLMMLVFSQLSFAKNTTFERINKNGVLVVGMSGDQPPFNFLSNQESMAGHDVDLAAMIAESLDVEMRITLMPFSELMGALKKQEIDIIISGFSYSEERSKEITFVGPYILSGKTILVTKKRLKEIQDTTGFNHKTVRLMALKDSTSMTLAKTRLSNAQLTPIKHYEQALLALRTGESDALVADLSIGELEVIRDTTQQLTTLKKPLDVEEIGMAINKDEPLLESRLSEKLRILTKSKELNALHEKWFKNPSWLTLLP